MKVQLKPGVELDVLTQAELHATLEQMFSGFARGPATDRATNPIPLDANGNSFIANVTPSPFAVFKVPSGYQFTLHRLALKSDGATFASPFTNSSGYVEIQRAGIMVDGIGLASPGLPMIFTAGSADGVVYDNNETVDVLIVGGPASEAVQAYLQGTLEPLTVF